MLVTGGPKEQASAAQRRLRAVVGGGNSVLVGRVSAAGNRKDAGAPGQGELLVVHHSERYHHRLHGAPL